MNILSLQNNISKWLENMTLGLDSGRFRFCSNSSFVPVTGMEGQVSTCFAMKAAWQAGIWDKWPEERKKACINFVYSFQKPDGCFHDPWLCRNAKTGWRDFANLILGHIDCDGIRQKKTRNIRAETRQTASTLMMVGAGLKYPLPIEISLADEVEPYIESFNWELPWSAGSHLSHQIMFLTINHICFDISEHYYDIIERILFCLEKFRDPITGTWFEGNTPDNIKINGAMKIFSGLQWLDKPYPDCTNLLDFALEQPFQCDGCGFLNRLFVVQQALKGSPKNFRQHDIHRLAVLAWEEIQKFRKPDGGFSFYQDKSQVSYYSAKVSKGYPVSDLHGATMMCWAIALIMELLGEKAPNEAKQWKIHKA